MICDRRCAAAAVFYIIGNFIPYDIKTLRGMRTLCSISVDRMNELG